MNYLSDAGALLVNAVFGLVLVVLLLRIALQAVRASFRNPVSQAIYQITNPVLMPLQRIMPVRSSVHWPGLVLAWLIAVVWIWVLLAMRGNAPGPAALLLAGFAKLIELSLTMATALIVVRVLLSFFGSDFDNPAVPLLAQLTNPMLKPFQRHIPPIAGFDLSPLFAMLAIGLVGILVVRPLFDLAFRGGL